MEAKQGVVIVDDDKAMCRSLEWLIESVGLNVEVYTDAFKFLESFNHERTNCLILDIRMPKISGIEIQSILSRKGIKVPIIFMTSHKDVSTAVKAMKGGALDFVTKPFSEQQMLDSIHRALKVDKNHRQQSEDVLDIQSKFSKLSKREQEVLELVVEGNLNKVIADKLCICCKTVELHRSRIMSKMHAKSLAHLVKMTITYKNYKQSEQIMVHA